MKRLYMLLSCVLVAIGVSLTYYYFEYAVRHSITYIWDTVLNTGTHRLLVLPTCVIISFMFFGIQHYLDPKSEGKESHTLGSVPKPLVSNFIKVIGIGFFSLIAGASLGPEAILVPASLIIGGYVASSFFKKDKTTYNLLAIVAFVALFTAFFNSFVIGILALFLMTKQLGQKANAIIVLASVVSSLITTLMLKLLSSSAYATLPKAKWSFSLDGILIIIGLFVGGYVVAYIFSAIHKVFETLHSSLNKANWWVHSVIASGVLSVIYLIGGSLIEFTGNESIVPMLQQSAKLGLFGLIWLAIIKLIAMGWSKTSGYRGGLIFPSIFVASILVAMVQLYTKDVGFTLGLVAVVIGLLAANKKVQVLF